MIPFTKWWGEDIVLSDNQKNTYTRKDLILYIANKDGGVHVDEEVSSNQYLLSKGKPTFEYIPSSSEELIEKTKEYLSSVIQIGYEVLQTLKIHSVV